MREHDIGIAPNTYYCAKKRAPSRREVRDNDLKPKIIAADEDNLFVYGAAKI